MKECEVDVINVIYKGYLEKNDEGKLSLKQTRLEEDFLKSLNLKQRQDFENVKLILRGDNLAEIKNAIRYTLKFVCNINNFERDKTKIYFD